MEGLGSIYLQNKLEASLVEALRCCAKFQDNWGVKLAYAGASPVIHCFWWGSQWLLNRPSLTEGVG